jgi:hypothetical protein
VADGLKRLAAEGVADYLDLAVLSTADGVARRVTHTWCDNSWDTVRSRGLKSTSRTIRVVE